MVSTSSGQIRRCSLSSSESYSASRCPCPELHQEWVGLTSIVDNPSHLWHSKRGLQASEKCSSHYTSFAGEVLFVPSKFRSLLRFEVRCPPTLYQTTQVARKAIIVMYSTWSSKGKTKVASAHHYHSQVKSKLQTGAILPGLQGATFVNSFRTDHSLLLPMPLDWHMTTFSQPLAQPTSANHWHNPLVLRRPAVTISRHLSAIL